MNNVWTSIALRAPCRQARAKPLLQLFHGYARNQVTAFGNRHTLSNARVELQRAFSTSPWLSGRGNKGRPAKPPTAPKYKTRAQDLAAPGARKQKVVGEKQKEEQEKKKEEERIEKLVAESEELTWRDFDAEGGMPLPGRELSGFSQAEIDEIFGTTPKSIDQETGNYILHVLHWRRMSGALIDVGLHFPKWTEASHEQLLNGLQYVRQLMPEYDERAAGAVWAEEESHRQAEVLRARAVKLGIYKDLEEEPMTEEEKREAEEFAAKEEEREQGTEEGRERVGDSALVRLRKQNEAAWEVEQAAKAAQKERDELAALHSQRGPLELLGGVQPSVALVKAEEQKTWLPAKAREKSDWVKKYEAKATLSKDDKIPDLSITARLGPSFLVLLATLAAAYWLAENYIPPPKSARMWPDTPVSIATLSAVTNVLLLTFVAFRMPWLWRAANKYFTLVPAYPYAISLLGCMVRHDTFVHLASNLVFLWFFGYLLHTNKDAGIDRGTFLAILLASGVIGSYTSLLFNVLRHNWAAYITGFSSAVCGVTAAVCMLRQNGNVHVPFTDWEVPYVAWGYLGLSFVGEAAMMLGGLRLGRMVVPVRHTNVDHAGHVGGYLAGVGAALWLRTGREGRRGEDGKGREGTLMVRRDVGSADGKE